MLLSKGLRSRECCSAPSAQLDEQDGGSERTLVIHATTEERVFRRSASTTVSTIRGWIVMRSPSSSGWGIPGYGARRRDEGLETLNLWYTARLVFFNVSREGVRCLLRPVEDVSQTMVEISPMDRPWVLSPTCK